MTIQHSAITADAEKHEPKGAASASAGQIIQFDGAGGTEVVNQFKFDNTVIVNSQADFPDPVAGVITLVNGTEYKITGAVNIGTNRLAVNAGSMVAISGIKVGISSITYTGSTPMTTVLDADIWFDDLTITAASAKVLDYTNTTAFTGQIYFRRCIFGAISQLSSVTNSQLYLLDNCIIASTLSSQAITFGGSNNLFTIHRGAVISYTGTLIDLGSAVFNDVDISSNEITNAAGNTFLAGLASSGNIVSGGAGFIRQVTFLGEDPVYSNVLPEDSSWTFVDNSRGRDSSTRGFLYFSDNTGVITISAASTYYDIAVDTSTTWTLASNSEGFSQPSPGILQIDSVKPLNCRAQVNMAVEAASTNKNIKVAVFQKLATDTTGTWTQVENISHDGFTSTTPRDITMSVPLIANEGDQFKAQISNETDSVNLTVKSIQFYIS